MVAPTLLEVIAARERDLRARLLAARARADAIVAEAAAQAETLRQREEAAASEEARAWLEAELDRARCEAEAAVAQAATELRRVSGDPAELQGAVDLVVGAVLLVPRDPGAPPPWRGPRTRRPSDDVAGVAG